MTPDQKPPPRTDMSTISTEAKGAAEKIMTWAAARKQIILNQFQIEESIQSAIDQSTAAMRDELERVRGEAKDNDDRSRRNFQDAQSAFGALGYGQENKHGYQNYVADQLRSQLAAQSARVQALEADKKRLEEALLHMRRDADGCIASNRYDCTAKNWMAGFITRIDAALSQEQATPRTG